MSGSIGGFIAGALGLVGAAGALTTAGAIVAVGWAPPGRKIIGRQRETATG